MIGAKRREYNRCDYDGAARLVLNRLYGTVPYGTVQYRYGTVRYRSLTGERRLENAPVQESNMRLLEPPTLKAAVIGLPILGITPPPPFLGQKDTS